MSSPLGHLAPGAFFIVFAIWWSIWIPIKHFHSCHSTKKSRKLISYHATTTYSCSCLPIPSLRQIPLESYIRLICISIGMIGEARTGYLFADNEASKRIFVPLLLPQAQHVAMYLPFGLATLIEILVHAKFNLPKGIEFIAYSIALGIEALLFHFHSHGRNDLDIHVHTLLVYSIVFCILTFLWEFNRPNQFLASYCKIAALLLQGVWLQVAGFVLDPISTDPYWIWPNNHESMLLLTIIFVFIGMLVSIFIFIESALVWWILKRRHADLNCYRMLNNEDEDEENNKERIEMSNNGTTGIHLNDDENDNQIEFEQSPLCSTKIEL